MNAWILMAAVFVAALAAAWLASTLIERRAQGEASALRQEMQAVAGQSQAVSAQVSQLSQTMVAEIGQVLQQVQSGVASAGTLASGTQKAVAEQLQATNDVLGSLRQQLGEVQQAGSQLFDAARHIESVLGSAKTRGMLGEVALEGMLNDSLPPGSYEMQYRFSTGEAVDAVVRLREKLLPIDSKFPLEDYRRLEECSDEARDAARGNFFKAVRKHADSIAKKYILPDERTLNLALMFVPSEGVYYELLHAKDGKGLALDEYCRALRVMPVSPSTLSAHLNVIMIGLQGLQVEQNARKIMDSLSGLKKQFDNFGELYDKVGGHLRNAQQCYSDADRKLERARNSLDELAQGVAPAEKALEPASAGSLFPKVRGSIAGE